MVRSILFTGDCPAAREVHEKKLEERRKQRADCSKSAAKAAAGARSKSNMSKTTGTATYRASVSPVKLSINEYLARLALHITGTSCTDQHSEEASQVRQDTWVLALETRDLLTVSSLCAVGFRADHIVVPNPDSAEIEAMRGKVFKIRSEQVPTRIARSSPSLALRNMLRFCECDGGLAKMSELSDTRQQESKQS